MTFASIGVAPVSDPGKVQSDARCSSASGIKVKDVSADIGRRRGEYLRARRALTAVNFFVETNRLEPYAAVYLIDVMGWDTVNFGIVSLVMNVSMVLFQTPAGDLLDKLESGKKVLTTLAILAAAVTTTMVVWTSNFWVILVGKTFEGICATVFLPALMSLLLGVARNDDEVPAFVAATEVSNKVGSFLIVIACASVTYFAYPHVEALFYLLGAGGVAAAFFTLLIPEAAIDHRRARQLEESSDEDADDAEEAEFEDVELGPEPGREETAAPSRYADLFRDRSIALFAALTFTYHLANAGPAPLLAQYVSSIVSEETSLTWTSAVMIAWFLPQALTAFLMTRVVDRYDHKRLLTVAFVTVPVRCLALAFLAEFWSRPWALATTQILEGVGAGVYDVMIPILVQKMTKGTGRFGFTFGFIVAMWRIGHGTSVLVGEMLVHSFGYTVAFATLGAIGLVNLIVVVVFFSFELDSPMVKAGAKEERGMWVTRTFSSSGTLTSTNHQSPSRRSSLILETAPTPSQLSPSGPQSRRPRRRVSLVSAGMSSRYVLEC